MEDQAERDRRRAIERHLEGEATPSACGRLLTVPVIETTKKKTDSVNN